MIWLLNDWDNGWHRLSLDDEIIYEGHSIPDRAWRKLLHLLGHQVSVANWESGKDEDDAQRD